MPEKKKAARSKKYVLDDQVGFVLRVAMQFHTAIFTARMLENLTQTQFATLAKLHEVGVCSQSDIGRTLVLDSATVNGVTDRLYARGFIDIVADPGDRRRQWISLSKKGLQTVEKAESMALEISEETVAALSETERKRLVQLLRKMIGSKMPSKEESIVVRDRTGKFPSAKSASRKPSRDKSLPLGAMKQRSRPRLLRRVSPE